MPSNQLGFQEWMAGEEILNSLKYARPGGGFESKCIFLEKSDVNGKNAHPLFVRLKEVLPLRNTSFEYELEHPHGVQSPDAAFKRVTWSPAGVTDIIWNFESFLIAPDGKPHARFHPHPNAYEGPIKAALKELLD
eukprot:SRR837773.3965.p2 GENE.SRR837773.3965~~SRR837773.3965.p2  ORF type:complete len:135 (+),score=42.16 SRR837773.3965:80-484(+)